MVDNVTSLTGNGLRDWLIQRISAVVVGIYAIFLVCFFICHSPMTFQTWQQLFTHTWMRVSSVVVLFCLILHAWIGVWTISTDYIKPTGLRIFIQALFVVCLLLSLVWGIDIFWRR